MHKQKLVACIKVTGKILRDTDDTVKIPFGSEYSIYLKNLNTVRASVKIEIDGVDALDGTTLVIQPNSSVDLERFIKSGNFDKGNRFKFIERNAKVEEHRGIGGEDGLIRVEFQFEKLPPKIETQTVIHKTVHEYHDHYWDGWRRPHYYSGLLSNTSCSSSGMLRSRSMDVGSKGFGGDSVTYTATSGPTQTITLNNAVGQSIGDGQVTANLSAQTIGNIQNYSTGAPQVINEAGITVAGSVSEQKFNKAAWFDCEDTKHVIVLKLLGETPAGKVEKAVTVKQKQTCSTCGTRNRGQNKFCRECGTSLELV